ncbi:MAG: HAMP domain-containing protein [Nitrosomonadales bacterium]|nr:HAMP domain-containing protein [Nitrosomonadales bacterium]
MKKAFNEFLRRLTFERQLGITVALGILFLALFSTLVGSWLSNERVRLNLLEQGQRITENLARQSALALIYASADNAEEAVNATMAFPGVVSVEIRDASQRILLTRGSADPAEFPAAIERAERGQTAAVLEAESRDAWRFAAPVYTQPSAESPFNVQTAAPELLGHVSVVMSKAALAQTTTDIFVANLATSFSFALLFLFLLRFLTNHMTRPLNQLSASMARAESGEFNVRAEMSGPKDIADMAHAFNSMMAVLEERKLDLLMLNETLEHRVADEAAKNREKDHLLIQQSRLAAIGEMIGNIAHQWRQPINTLTLLLANIKDAYEFNELDKDSLDRMVKEGQMIIQRMSTTIDDFRNFFRPNKEKSCFSVNEVVADVLRILEAAFRNSGIAILVKGDENAVMAYGYRNEYSQVLINVLVNAKDVLQERKVADACVHITISCRDALSEVDVEDNAGGIPDDVLPKIFDPYFTTKEKGTGIGLYMSKMIIENNMDGRIAACNTGDGARLSIVVPSCGTEPA